jgi:hypothetical protein
MDEGRELEEERFWILEIFTHNTAWHRFCSKQVSQTPYPVGPSTLDQQKVAINWNYFNQEKSFIKRDTVRRICSQLWRCYSLSASLANLPSQLNYKASTSLTSVTDRAACPTVLLRTGADLKLKLEHNEFIYPARAMNSLSEPATGSWVRSWYGGRTKSESSWKWAFSHSLLCSSRSACITCGTSALQRNLAYSAYQIGNPDSRKGNNLWIPPLRIV